MCAPCFQSSRLFLKPEESLNNIGIEMVHSCEDFRIYLDIYCLKIPPFKGEECLGQFKLFVDEEETEWVVNRLEGGQRLLLTPEATEALLNALLEDHCVTVSIGCYKTVLTLNNFARGFEQLRAFPFQDEIKPG